MSEQQNEKAHPSDSGELEWRNNAAKIYKRSDGSRFVRQRYSSYDDLISAWHWYERRDDSCKPEGLATSGDIIQYEYVQRAFGPVDFNKIVDSAYRHIWRYTTRGGVALPSVLVYTSHIAAMARDLWGPDEPVTQTQTQIDPKVRKVDYLLVEATMNMLKDFATHRSLLHECYDVHGDMLAINCVRVTDSGDSGDRIVFISPGKCTLLCAEIDLASLYLSWHGWPHCAGHSEKRELMFGWRPIYTRPVAMLLVAHLIKKLHNNNAPCEPYSEKQLCWAQALLVEQLCLLGYLSQDVAMAMFKNWVA